MGYRRQQNDPQHVFVHGKGDWEQEALRRQRNFQFAVRIVMTSFFVVFDFLRNIYERFFPSRDEAIALGRHIDEYGQEGEIIGLPVELLNRHLHVLGGTGRGKTTLLVNMAIQLMLMGRSIVIVDVKGDFANGVQRFIPPNRLQDVILFDPSDTEYPIAWNIFHKVSEEDRSRLAGEIVLVIRKLVGMSWGPRLDSLLRLAILALLEVPGHTFLDLYYFFTDQAFRSSIVSRISNDFVKEYWEVTFASWSASQQATAINPVLNKLEPFLSYPIARNILGQPDSSFSLREVIDSGKILLIHIPQGILGEDLSKLLGGLMVAKLHMEIISRQNIPIKQRRPAVLMADEFQEIASESFEQTLSLARSYGVACVVANQYPGQLPPKLIQALDSNCAVRLTGHLDSGLHLLEFDLLQDIEQPKFFIRPLLPAQGPSDEIAQSVRTLSRLRYGTEREDVERLLTLRHQRRLGHAQRYKEELQRKNQVQRTHTKAQQQTGRRAKQGTTQSTQQQQKSPKRTPGASKPTVMQHGTQSSKPAQTAQTRNRKRRPKHGGNTP